MPSESILEVIDRRLRARPAELILYEHEVSKLAEVLSPMSREPRPIATLESDIRSGFFRYRGYPVRVDGEPRAPGQPT